MKCFIIAALTADGFIAEDSGQPATWTGKADKKFFVEQTKRAGVMVMGRKTYDTIGRPLPGRLTVVYSHHVERDKATPNLLFTNLPPSELLTDLSQRGYQEVAICGGASIYTMFMQAGLVDTLYLTIEPKIFGQGISLLNDKTVAELSLQETTKLDEQTVLLTYHLDTHRAS